MTLALLVAGALLAASLFFFWLAVRPPRITVRLRPADVGLIVQDVRIPAADGVTLAGWLVPRPGAPAVVMLHGYPAEKADLLPMAAALAPRFEVLLMDLRYFGESGGRVTTLGVRERDDLRRAVDVLAGRGAPRIGAFGFSLGGAVALLAAADDPRLAALAVYAPFSDLRTLGLELHAWMGPLKYPLVELMMLWGRLLLGVDFGAASPAAAARRIAAPVLLVHSRQDEQIAPAHAERFREALAANPGAEVTVLDAGRHGELPPGLTARFVAFFRRHLEGSAPDHR